VRTPFYTRGHVGLIESVAGMDPNPELLAYGRLDEPTVPLYRVRFIHTELWTAYTGSAQDATVVDIFEHWLEASDDA
jgi:nitrile hydratase